ncbi:hypothetical protein N7495_009097 [Penicillium taxi]|uniref:uncharacterized protein n=1 Tax=Penicillium taxi TaxID=168475 RepID=UPI002544DD81|nr:uncharacterized protein N7495_009097 [Penicillium taxi]KAJ5889056.1 hypothetical protein N7495_009097 [Penicillium taxi]
MADSYYWRDPLNPHEYYASLSTERNTLVEKFKDIDNKVNFQEYIHRIENPQTSNFVLDFGNEDVYCGADLSTNEFNLLLSKPRTKCFGTRWINIWSPEEQKDTIKAITTFYGLSERLQGMMCTEPVLHRPKPVARNRSYSSSAPPTPQFDDIENAYALKNIPDEPHQNASFNSLTFARVVEQIMHFSSIDHGPHYTCVGYNTLFVTPGVSSAPENGKGLPEGKRLWNWLILCDDGTVISIQENPFPRQHTVLEQDQAKVIDIARRNTRFIFSGVSKEHSTMSESDSLVTIRVRPFYNLGPDQANIKQEDGPSLLFYYIFDDWVSSYGLIAKREHQYGVALERLRGQMLDRPIVDLVNELHWLGHRLAVLKNLYQSYELIMRRLLQHQSSLHDEPHQPLSIGSTFHNPDEPEVYLHERKSSIISHASFQVTSNRSIGVRLSSGAVARFERLVDRINLYCLSEIETCLREKESLTFLNFNLIALKDSQAVEKLTRITILLAKATILFLPVSLMTAYFSTELRGVKGGYTKADYWVAFAVIFFLTGIILYIFGAASQTLEGKTIYRSLVKTFFTKSRDKMRQGQRKELGTEGI